MVDVITKIAINRPLQDVAEYAADPENATEWYENIKSVEWKTEKPLRIGSRVAFVAHFMGRRLAYTYEVMEMSSRRFVMRTAEGPFPMETTYEWTKVDDHSTTMSLRNRGNPSGFSRIFAPFMSRMMRRANQKDLEAIKRILESRNSK